ncbi:MAG: hypothetical protein AB7I30_01085 [Isosphaeraceae bacterium]
MFPATLSDRLDAMIDELIMDGSIESASLVSILLAAKDSLKSDTLLTLSRTVWAANNDLRAETLVEHGSEGFREEPGDLSLEPARTF